MDAFKKGYQAFWKGNHTNPYPPKGVYDEHEYWIDGWQKACKEYCVNNGGL